MKRYHSYLLTFLFVWVGKWVEAQETKTDFELSVQETQTVGSFIAKANKTEPGEKFFYPGIHDIAIGDKHYFYILDDGELWALRKDGQSDPFKVAAKGVQDVTSDGFRTWYVTQDGNVHSFYEFELPESPEAQEQPFAPKPTGLTNVNSMSAGKHSLLLARDRSLWGLGLNLSGELGIENQTHAQQPQKIVESGVQSFAASHVVSLFVKDDHSLWGMGHNHDGRLGPGENEFLRTPTLILKSGVLSVAAGPQHTYFIRKDGTLWGMGNPLPTNPSTVGTYICDDVHSVSAGNYLCLILKNDGSLWVIDQLPSVEKESSYEPKRLLDKGVRLITTDWYGGLFTTDNGVLWSTDGQQLNYLLAPSKFRLPKDAENHLFDYRNERLYVKAPLNFEQASAHKVYFHLTSPDGETSLQSVAIQVQENPEAPYRIELDNSTFPENPKLGTVIGKFHALDDDVGEEHTFQLVSSENLNHWDNQLFEIQSNGDGEHTLVTASTEDFDFETRSSFSIQVQVTDKDGLTFTQALALHLKDVNEPPGGLTLSNNSFAKNTLPGTSIGQIATTLNDAEDSISYSFATIEGEPNNNHLFTLEETPNNTAVLQTKAELADHQSTSLTVCIQATDQSGLSATKTFEISLGNEAIVNLENLTLAEEQPIGTKVANIVCPEADIQWTLPGVRKVVNSGTQTLFIEGNGALWYIENDKEPFKVVEHGVRSATFGMRFQILFVKADSSLWGLGNPKQIPDPSMPLLDLSSSPFNILEKGVREVYSSDFILKTDGTLWKLGDIYNQDLHEHSKASSSLKLSRIAGPEITSFKEFSANNFSRNLYFTQSDGSLSVLIQPPEKSITRQISSNGVDRFTISEDRFWFRKLDGSLWNFEYEASYHSSFMNIRGFEEPKLILRSNVADFAFGRKIGLLLMKDGSLWEMNSRKVLEPHKKRDHILFGGQADPFGPAPGAIAREPVTPSYQTFIPSRTPIAESVVSIEQSWYEDSAYFIKSDGSLWQLKTEEFPQKQVQLPIDPFDEKYVKVDPIPPGKLESKYTYPPQSLHFPEKDWGCPNDC